MVHEDHKIDDSSKFKSVIQTIKQIFSLFEMCCSFFNRKRLATSRQSIHELSDVKIVVEGVKMPAHKLILSASSSYFRAMFSNGFVESRQIEVELKVPLEPFKLILRYMYTGCMSFAPLDSDQIIELYNLANLYGFESLKNAISKYLKRNISIENCISMLISAQLYPLADLKEACLNFIDHSSIKLMHHDTFKATSQDTLCDILKRDTFYAPEIDIFNAVKNWFESNPNDDVKVSPGQSFNIILCLIDVVTIHFLFLFLN